MSLSARHVENHLGKVKRVGRDRRVTLGQLGDPGLALRCNVRGVGAPKREAVGDVVILLLLPDGSIVGLDVSDAQVGSVALVGYAVGEVLADVNVALLGFDV